MTRNRYANPTFIARGLALCGVLALVAVAPARAAETPDGVRLTPDIGWKQGDHRVDLSFDTRFRYEYWDDRAPDEDAFYALRTRFGVKYSFRDRLQVFGEFQDVRLYSLGRNTSGAGGLYRRFADQPGGMSRTNSQKVRQLYLQLMPIEGLALRVGRFDIKLGTEVLYPEGNWKYLKIARASQRLVGTVGWTHAERSNDGVSVAWDMDGHHVFGFAARPTQGVFDIENAYGFQEDITYGGLSWTIKRGTLLENTEIRPFFLAYDDDRSTRHGGLRRSVNVYTFGFSAIGVYPMGPGNLDVLAWAAYQHGRYDSLDHDAGAGILELGYQLTDVVAKPWFRLGVNVASGDDDPSDGDHGTFFNMLPTNHLYYGFADQFAFQNLIDLIAQIKLAPHSRVGVNLMFHKFWVVEEDDAAYAGTGAFNRTVFGYVPGLSTSANEADARSLGTEIDLVVDVKVTSHLGVQAGYARIWGHGPRNAGRDDNTDFAYAQLSLKY